MALTRTVWIVEDRVNQSYSITNEFRSLKKAKQEAERMLRDPYRRGHQISVSELTCLLKQKVNRNTLRAP